MTECTNVTISSKHPSTTFVMDRRFSVVFTFANLSVNMAFRAPHGTAQIGDLSVIITLSCGG